MKIGSLFTGSGQLDEGVKAVVGGDVAWHVEFDKAASAVLAHNYPGIPNHRDVTSVDWSAVEPVDIITGGFPCQDVSAAGKRAGLGEGTRSGLWAEMHRAVDVLRPSLVVIENVRGLLSARTDTSRQFDTVGPKGGRKVGHTDRAIGRVLADLADIGYDATWVGLRASDAGAAHQRFRVFIVAHPADAGSGPLARPAAAGDGLLLAAERGDRPASDAGEQRRDGVASVERGGRLSPLGGEAGDHAGNPGQLAAADTDRTRREGHRPVAVAAELAHADRGGAPVPDVAWGKYEPAIRRWERTVGRVAPSPTEPGPRSGQRLSPPFVEWLMGWPAGWVTEVPGLTRNDQLKICGNGVVPQQAELAIRTLLNMKENT